MKLFEQLAKLKIQKEEVIARNVLFNKSSENFLKELEEKGINPQVKKYVESNLKNWIINEYKAKLHTVPKSNDPSWVKPALERGDKVYDISITPKDKTTFRHWVDFLNQYDKPNSISKISIPQLIEHVKKWEESFQKIKSNEEDGIRDIHDYPDGYKWVEVFGENSLNREGKLMNHCVGSYYNQVKNGHSTIYSLRDKENKPHITIEFNPKEKSISQIKGNSNQPVKSEYLPYLNDLLKKKYIKFKNIDNTDLVQNGLIYINNEIYNLDNLPDDLHVKEERLNLKYSKITRLPKNLYVEGTLDLSYSHLTEIPEGLHVDGSLDLGNTKITKIGDGLYVGDSLSLNDSLITELPRNLFIGGSLNARGSKLKKISNGTHIGGSCEVSNTPIEKFPNDISIGGSLYIDYSKITKLPTSITKINGDFYLNNSPMEELPNNLEVSGSIRMSETNVVKLPKNLVVGNSLYLKKSKVKEVSEGLTVGYIFDIADSNVTKLAHKMNIKGNFIVLNSKVTELPDDLVVGGFLNLVDSKVTVIPETIKVGGIIYYSKGADLQYPEKFADKVKAV